MTVAAAAIAALALVVAVGLAVQVYVLRRRLDAVPPDADIFSLLKGIDNELGRLDAITSSVEPRLASVERRVPRALTHTGVVNYDAFGDIAGNLSRSIALLSDEGDGIVISMLVGRGDVRLFTKEVRGFDGVEELSPEEKAAVLRASGGSLRP
jgi:hypothetical protein